MAPFVTLAFSTFVVVATALAPRHEGHDHGNDNGHASSGTATAVPTVTTPTTSPAPQVSECYSTYSYTGVLGTSISDFAGHESLVELLASYTASGDDVVDTYTTFDAEAGEYLYGKVWKNQLIAHGVTEFTTATTVLTIPCETSSPASEETSDAEPEKSTEPTNSAEDTSAPTETEGPTPPADANPPASGALKNAEAQSNFCAFLLAVGILDFVALLTSMSL